MPYFERNIDNELTEWKSSTVHKPLLLRGARQVGKSMSLRNLGRQFKHFIEINLEQEPNLRNLFVEETDVRELARRIGVIKNIPVIPGETLLFIDEIQSCPEALKSLWFFKENFPELHVAAAGSLLEFTLRKIPSYGVGRVRSLFMYPMSFNEYLTACGKSEWVKAIREADWNNPLYPEMHKALVREFRSFLLVGGMPASVAAWVATKDYSAAQDEQNDIQQSYYDDFAKYGDRISPQLLRNTLASVIMQIGKKFVYSKVEGNYRLEEVKEALGLLRDAGIIIPIQMSASNGLPLGAQVNPKFTRYTYLDTGLLLRVMDMIYDDSKELTEMILAGDAPYLVNKGVVAEMTAGLELLKSSSPKSRYELFYWENLDRNATSEVEYILAKAAKVVPLEVKAGVSGKMKSLNIFMQKKQISVGLRTSLENFGCIRTPAMLPSADTSRPIERIIGILPLYSLWNLTNLPLPE